MIRQFSSATVSLCALVLLSSPLAGNGKSKPPRSPAAKASASPAPAAEPADSAHLRLWKACDGQREADLQIRLLPVENRNGKAGTALSANKDPYQFTGYDDVPAGPGVVEVILVGQPPIRLDVNLTKNQDYTLVVRAQHGKATAELLSDSRPGDPDPSFSVYSLLFGGKGDVQVTLGDALMVHLNTIGGRLRARGIKADFYPVTVSGKDGKGQPFRWNAETDLRKVSRSALIVCLDVYGRVRPQLIEDGLTVETVTLSGDAPSKRP